MNRNKRMSELYIEGLWSFVDLLCKQPKLKQTSWRSGKIDRGFDVFLEWCINVVGSKEESARGHFRHAGVNIAVCDT